MHGEDQRGCGHCVANRSKDRHVRRSETLGGIEIECEGDGAEAMCEGMAVYWHCERSTRTRQLEGPQVNAQAKMTGKCHQPLGDE